MMGRRAGFTLMEIVLVMVLIAILATGVAIGFTSYINRGHETGITTDYNSSFKNPIRMEVISNNKLPKMAQLKDTLIADGFTAYSGTDWIHEVVENDTVFGVEKGNKRYEVTLTTFDGSTMKEGSGSGAIIVRADHSRKETTAVYVLNSAKDDVITYVGAFDDSDVLVID